MSNTRTVTVQEIGRILTDEQRAVTIRRGTVETTIIDGPHVDGMWASFETVGVASLLTCSWDSKFEMVVR
jgi:hypothetical protein